MIREETIKTLKGEAWVCCQKKWQEALDVAIKSTEVIGHLKNRPCEACDYHDEDGCHVWTCVFDELIYEKHNK